MTQRRSCAFLHAKISTTLVHGWARNNHVCQIMRAQSGTNCVMQTHKTINNTRKQRRGSLLGGRLRSRDAPLTRLAVSAKRSLAGGSDKAQPLIPKKLQGRIKLGVLTTIRVAIPSILAGVVAFFAFPSLSLWLCSLFQDQGVFAVLSQDSSQFVQNFPASVCTNQTY